MAKDQEDLRETAAHEMGHVIACIVGERNFDYVWIRGVNEGLDKWYGKDPSYAGYVRTYRNGKMTFDGRRVKVSDDNSISAEDYLLGLRSPFRNHRRQKQASDANYKVHRAELRPASFSTAVGELCVHQRPYVGRERPKGHRRHCRNWDWTGQH